MGKARVQSSSATLHILDEKGTPIKVGDVLSFNVNSLGELKTHQAAGEDEFVSQEVFRGYEMSFEGAKTDGDAAMMFAAQDAQTGAGGRSPYYIVKETVKHYDGTVEIWVYENVTLHGYNGQTPNLSDLGESFKGFGGKAKYRDASATNNSKERMATKRSNIEQMLQKMTEGAILKAPDVQ
jgi:hypothetical protein